MNDEVSWRVELAVKPGQLDNFRMLTGEMIETALSEHGVLSYARFASEDGMTVHVYERYFDSRSAVGHLETFATKYGSRFLTMVERRHFTVYGNPTTKLREVLDTFNPTYMTSFGEFPYWL